MNYYYELADSIVPKYGNKYFVQNRLLNRSEHDKELMLCSDRVWAENNGHIYFVKNRFKSVNTAKVDMKEFFVVKLKSTQF